MKPRFQFVCWDTKKTLNHIKQLERTSLHFEESREMISD